MTRIRLILLAAGGSAFLLLGAWGFQALGYPPCELCLWQRWPHGAAVVIGALAVTIPWLILPLFGAAAAATTGAIGVYHTGVERGWWQGPSSCSSGDVGGLTTAELMDQILAAPLVRCNEVAWSHFGLSMASWNALISFALAAIWLLALKASRT